MGVFHYLGSYLGFEGLYNAAALFGLVESPFDESHEMLLLFWLESRQMGYAASTIIVLEFSQKLI